MTLRTTWKRNWIITFLVLESKKFWCRPQKRFPSLLRTTIPHHHLNTNRQLRWSVKWSNYHTNSGMVRKSMRSSRYHDPHFHNSLSCAGWPGWHCTVPHLGLGLYWWLVQMGPNNKWSPPQAHCIQQNLRASRNRHLQHHLLVHRYQQQFDEV